MAKYSIGTVYFDAETETWCYIDSNGNIEDGFGSETAAYAAWKLSSRHCPTGACED